MLKDLIPVTQPVSLDERMRDLVPDLLENLGHSAPALRKSALDSLRKYVKHSRNDDFLLQLMSVEGDSIITAAPFLISKETSDRTLKKTIGNKSLMLRNFV